MSQTLIENTYHTIDYTVYALVGGIIAGFLVDYTNIPGIIMVVLGLILTALDLGVSGEVAKILEGIGYALMSLGAYEIIKTKLTFNVS